MSIEYEPPRKSVTLCTTSREPSPRTRSLLKDLSALSSNLLRVTRGKMTYKELLFKAFSVGAKTLAIIGEKKGNPSIIRIYDTEPLWLQREPVHVFTLFIKGVSLSRERGHGLPSRPVEYAYVVTTDSFVSDAHRTVSLALSRIFSATIVPPRAVKHGLKAFVVPKDNLFVVYFKLEDKPVGPVIKIDEARIIGRPVPGGQTEDIN